MRINMIEVLDKVHDEETFLEFVRLLSTDCKKHNSNYSHDWANSSIESYLESALAWAEDSQFGKSQDATLVKNHWKRFAMFLYAGKIYE